jgi:cell division topological specificity factor
MPALRQELIAVISKYTQVSPADINISLDKKGHLEVLDVNVVLPDGGAAR